MNIEELNQITIQTVLNAASSGVDEGIKISRMQYENIQNDYFREAMQSLEKFLFRLYECKYLFKDQIVDLDCVRYLTDDEYYHTTWIHFHDSLSKDSGQEAYEHGVELVKEKDYVEAGKYFKEAALSGNGDGQYNYGVTVSNGEGREADGLEGAFWYWESAKHSNPKAMLNLAIEYRNGNSVKESGIQMLYWYACSAALENPYAVYNLGLSLKNGEVLQGNEQVGRLLIDASDMLDQENACDFVQRMTGQIIDLLEEHVYNVE